MSPEDAHAVFEMHDEQLVFDGQGRIVEGRQVGEGPGIAGRHVDDAVRLLR